MFLKDFYPSHPPFRELQIKPAALAKHPESGADTGISAGVWDEARPSGRFRPQETQQLRF